VDQDEDDDDPGGGHGEREGRDETAHLTNLPLKRSALGKRARDVAAGTMPRCRGAHDDHLSTGRRLAAVRQGGEIRSAWPEIQTGFRNADERPGHD